MKILEEMLEVEAEARQIVEQAKAEANVIRKKARDDAKQYVINGKNELQERIKQEIQQIETQAAEQKNRILEESETHLKEKEQKAREHIHSAVEHVVNVLLKHEIS